MKAGVIINISAGRFEILREKISKLEHVFDEIITGPGKFGENFLRKAEVENISSSNFKEAIKELTLKLSEKSDVIVSVGGDGTANMIAEVIINEGIDIPIMGIGGGTANVGPLIRFSLDSLEKPSRIETVNCLKVWKGDKHVGYAFVDVVFGDTFLGTLENKVVNLSAENFLKDGKKVSKIPCDDIAECLEIFRGEKKIQIHNIGRIAQVVASPLNFSKFYIGKAITGILCWAPFFKAIGALIVSSRVVVNSQLTQEDMKSPVVLEQILFNIDETIKINGLRKGVYLILDGNPICECDAPVILRGLKECVKVFTGSQKSCYPIGEGVICEHIRESPKDS